MLEKRLWILFSIWIAINHLWRRPCVCVQVDLFSRTVTNFLATIWCKCILRWITMKHFKISLLCKKNNLESSINWIALPAVSVSIADIGNSEMVQYYNWWVANLSSVGTWVHIFCRCHTLSFLFSNQVFLLLIIDNKNDQVRHLQKIWTQVRAPSLSTYVSYVGFSASSQLNSPKRGQWKQCRC